MKKRKSFCGTTKQEVKEKITAYLADFDRQLAASDESKAKLEESMGRWFRVFKFPSVERGTYDRLECTAKHQIYPILGGKVVGDITSADIKALLNHWMNEGYAYTTVKKVYKHPHRLLPLPDPAGIHPKESNGCGSHDQEVKLHGQPGQGGSANLRNRDHLHPGGDRKVQGGRLSGPGETGRHLSAGGRLYADAEHRTSAQGKPSDC